MRFSRGLSDVLAALVFALVMGVDICDEALGAGSVPPRDLRWIRQRMQAIRREAQALSRPVEPSAHMESARQKAAAVAGSVPLPAALRPVAGAGDGLRIYVFVSSAMGEHAVRQALRSAAGRPEVSVVLRGIREGQTIRRGVLWIQQLAEGIEPPPDLQLDPLAFSQYAVQTVPQMVMVSPDGAVKARVRGLSDPQWLLGRVAGGESGDLGSYGPVRGIAEPDLIAVMRGRIGQIDWAQRKRQAANRFWEHAVFEPLPAAREPAVRRIDPTLVITRDIETPDGVVVARAGERINPLRRRRFTQRLVVFDATRLEQVEKVLTLGPGREGVTGTVYMTTRLARGRAWDQLREIEDALQAPLYLLTPEVRTRFDLRRVPSVVTAEEEAFIVREIPVDADPRLDAQGHG